MTNAQINDIIAAREVITRLPEFVGLLSAVDALDRVLASVPPGQREDVDALLGRPVDTRRCTCGYGYLTIPRDHEDWCDLRQPRVVMAQHADGATEIDTEWSERA